MDFRKEIVRDPSVTNTKRVAKFVVAHPKELKSLVKLISEKDENISMRSAWIISHVCLLDSELIARYLPDFVKFLNKKDNRSGTIRCILNCLEKINLPEKYCAEIFDFCMNYIKNATLPHAVRAFSITILGNICKTYPELKPEVELVLSELKTFPQPASITVRIRDTSKILLKL